MMVLDLLSGEVHDSTDGGSLCHLIDGGRAHVGTDGGTMLTDLLDGGYSTDGGTL